MGPFRRGVILALLPGTALAEVCDKERPGWDGTPVTLVGETLTLFASPASILLLVGTMLVLRFRSQLGGVVITVLWTLLISMITMYDPTGIQPLAKAEGCIGSPALFIGLVAAICAGTIMYTAPRNRGPEDGVE